MPSNRKLLNAARLYLILDAQVLDHARLLRVLKESVRFGIGIVQLRDKFGDARDILAFCRQAKKITAGRSLFILNDRLDLALLGQADGVHLGQGDISCRDARSFLGPQFLIGVSCQTMAHLGKAEKDGADYIGFGSVFVTKTKPERKPMDPGLLRRALRTAKVPMYPIGGINRENAGVVVDAGARRFAVCRDILLSQDRKHVIEEFKRILA